MGTTGDGIATGLRLMSRMAQTNRSLAALAEPMRTLPQVLINVRGVDRAAVDTAPGVVGAVAAAASRLGDTGRVLLRSSGTEPLVRVMVEAPTDTEARTVAEELAAAVAREIPLA
jgi:phosphoglucosamine mutase